MEFVAPEIFISYFSTRDILAASVETDWYTTVTLCCCDCPGELPMD